MHVLGILDLLAAVFMLGGHYGMIKVPLLYTAIYLFAKFALFRDFFSAIDAMAGVYAVYLFFVQDGSGLTWLFMIFFLYKTSVWMFYTLGN